MSLSNALGFLPVSEVMSRVINLITETLHAASDVLCERENLGEVMKYLENLRPILREFSQKDVADIETVQKCMEILEREVAVARQMVSTCTNRSKFYLLLNCRSILKKLQNCTREIGHALSLLPLAMLDVTADIQQKTSQLSEDMQKAEFKAALSEDEIMERIELGIKERNTDTAYANSLLFQIAKTVGISVDTATLKQEFEEFKKDAEEVKLRKNQAEAFQMEQIIGLLSAADAATSRSERDHRYHQKKMSLGTHPMPPLQSFFCPISQELMEDPVEIVSGQTFERAPIEKWLAEGNVTCPLTKQLLVSKELRPNIILRRSIDEWKDRNTMITIATLKSNLDFTEEKTVIMALDKLVEYSEGKAVHKQWIAAEGYIPILVSLLQRNKPLVRKRTLTLLCSLVKDNEDNKVRLAQVNDAMVFIVRSLSRDISEGSKAAWLLLELSKNNDICKLIGKVKGCIFLLVTLSNNENAQAANSAKALLENLSYSEDHIIQMAEANYFKPILQKLIEGSQEIKIIMANALSEISLTDKNKVALLKEGVLTPLLNMLSDNDFDGKMAAGEALETLSKLPENAAGMIEQGMVEPILGLLSIQKSVVLLVKEKAANIFLNLAMSVKLPGKASTMTQALLRSHEVICQLLSTINLTPPTIQKSLIQALHAICSAPSPSLTYVRRKLTEEGAFPLLLPFCEGSDSEIRPYAVKLLYQLCQDGNETTLAEHLDERYTKYVVKLLSDSLDEEEKAAALGIIGSLPLSNQSITNWLLEAETLSIIISILSFRHIQFSGNIVKNQLLENAVAALCRFTRPTDIDLQQKVASADLIPILVELLSSGTVLAKSRAAISLAQFSQNSRTLTRRIKPKKSLLCFSSPAEMPCRIHGGRCATKTSFCLIEAEAINPLVDILGERDDITSEASLQALSTLLHDECLENGADVLEEAGAFRRIIPLLTSPSIGVQEKAVMITEKVLRIERYKSKYGNLAQVHLIEITQRATSATKSLAAKTLAHLNIIPEQSSYF